jgi:hypothetical protein
MNLTQISDRLGDWNPQLLRELKGRFTSNSLTFILITSAVLQLLFCLWLVNGNSSGAYRFPAGFYFLNWCLPMVAIFGGCYSLTADLNHERKSGTFDFVRSSPQSGRSIFLGKLIGVPSLVYLAVLSLVPLHFGLAVLNGANLGLMLLWYLTVGSIGYLCLVFTCLYVVYGGKFAIVYALLTSQPINVVLLAYNYYLNATVANRNWQIVEAPNTQWFYLPVGNNIWLFYLFSCCSLLTLSNCLWLAIDRKYIDPLATPIGKKDSYAINFCTQVWLVGFALPLMQSRLTEGNLYTLSVFQTISTISIVCTIPLLLPNRINLQEWICDWQQQHGKLWRFDWRDPKLIRELMWSDRSPAIVTVGINLAISAIAWTIVAIIVVILSPQLALLGKFIVGAIVSSILTLIYTVVVHIQCLRTHLKNSEVIPVIFLMSSLPLLCSFFLMVGWSSSVIYQSIACTLLLFSPLFWLGIGQLPNPVIALAAIAQLGILMGTFKTFDRQLLKLGELTMSASSQRPAILGRGSS